MPALYDIMTGMVRFINKGNMKFIGAIVSEILHWQEYGTKIVEINNHYIYPCVYALWHENQCGIHGIQNKEKVNVLVSNSIDGEIIAKAIERMGFKTARGSSERKGSVSATMQLITRLKNGEQAAIMMDGPRGPLHKIKGGVIKLAKETGAPIIPLQWYSEDLTFITLPSWDKMKYPFTYCEMINLYGDPIYVKPEDDDDEIRKKIMDSLTDLENRSHEEFVKAKQQKLWKKQREQEKLKKKSK